MWENLVRRLTNPNQKTDYVFADIDGTLVDSSSRDAKSSDPAVRESLITLTSDPIKTKVVDYVANEVFENRSQVVLISGRCRSSITKKQLSFLPFEYRFIRNSKLYNPTLSSRTLKASFFRYFLYLSSLSQHKGSRTAKFLDDREDVIQVVQQVFEELGVNYKLSKYDGIFLFEFCF